MEENSERGKVWDGTLLTDRFFTMPHHMRKAFVICVLQPGRCASDAGNWELRYATIMSRSAAWNRASANICWSHSPWTEPSLITRRLYSYDSKGGQDGTSSAHTTSLTHWVCLTWVTSLAHTKLYSSTTRGRGHTKYNLTELCVRLSVSLRHALLYYTGQMSNC